MRPIAAAAAVLLAACLAILAFGAPLGPALQSLAEGSLASPYGLARTSLRAVPLILVGLGVASAWRAGAFSIGGEGQFVVGAMAGAFVARAFASSLGPWTAVPLLLAAAGAGAAFAALAAWLQTSRGVQLVVSTILLNFVALKVLEFMVDGGPLQEHTRTQPISERLPEPAWLHRFFPQFDFHAGFFVALAAAAVVFLWLYKTQGGFRLRLAGAAPLAARAARVSTSRQILVAMAVSGALCGLAGGIEFAGVSHVLTGQGFARGWGYLGIPVALLSGMHPLGVIGSGLLFGALYAGSENLGRFTPGGDRLLFVVQGAAVLAYTAFTVILDRRRPTQHD